MKQLLSLLTFRCQFVSSQWWGMAIHRIKAWRYENHVWGKLIGNRHNHRPVVTNKQKRQQNNVFMGKARELYKPYVGVWKQVHACFWFLAGHPPQEDHTV